MKVSELKELLEYLVDNKEIVFKPTNSQYVYDIEEDKIESNHMIRTFFGVDLNDVYILKSSEQIGADWGVA